MDNLEKLDELIAREIMLDNNPHITIKNNNVYHYTSATGFEGIIKNSCLWFTRYDCVNDTTEGSEINKIFKKTCDKLLDEGKISIEFYNSINNIEPYLSNGFGFAEDGLLKVKLKESQYFISCFSRESDSLPMWNYYIKNNNYQGFNLEFFIKDLFETGFEKGYYLNFYNVIYDDEIKFEILSEKILNINNYFSTYTEEKINFYLKFLLAKLMLLFKNKAFKHEKEVRAILIVPKDCDKIEFREMNGYIIPYIAIPFKAKKNLLGVTIAPLYKDELAKRTLFEFLNKKGFTVYLDNIVNSKIPIRF